ncbi:carboxylesterase family protein [Streptomyces sodiiphilus]|uniref:Carboxylic ester hydrolase n=1 Tax=Streptomyces sodiiphilus TaxID=226217 RepID=A0ABN2NQ36_9ACTN
MPGEAVEVRRTENGRVRGRGSVRGVLAFLGIPYAAPPFGANRFREPCPVRRWEGVRDCRSFGPVAPQSAELPGMPAWSPGREDILTLNIWTPAAPGGPLPVVVWIHGGAYTFGSSAQPDFDGTALARAGVVLVSMNYRLGFEGFGHMPSEAGPRCPENRGLLDQLAALEWVRDNIAAFGGDPTNVTVAGQSAGATSAACLMVMERARGLFRRVIAHSPVGPCFPAELAVETTHRVAAAAGVPATSAGLASATPEALIVASEQVVRDYRGCPGSGARYYNPVIDGDVLPGDPVSLAARAATGGVDLLVCHTAEEGWLLHATDSIPAVTTGEQLADFTEAFQLPDELIEGYRGLMPGAPVLDLYLAVFGDLLFSQYAWRLAEAHARSGGRAFESCFARRRTAPPAVVHAWHCADIPFAFGTLTDENVAFLIGRSPTAADHRLSRRMGEAWAGFATDGHPGWRPVGSPGAAGRTWSTPDSPALPDNAAIHDLWRRKLQGEWRPPRRDRPGSAAQTDRPQGTVG